MLSDELTTIQTTTGLLTTLMPTDQRIFDQLVDRFVQNGSDRSRIHDHTPVSGSSFMGYQGGALLNLLEDINDWFLPTPAITAANVNQNNTAEALADLIEDRGGRPH